jgi:DNA-binding NarL/FixJ family response regulator
MIRVVVSDDHSMFREGLVHLLKQAGIDVIAQCSNGTEALEAIRSFLPDIALLDVSMPEMDGISVAEQVSKDPEKTRLIMLTMHDSPDVCRRAFDAGAFGYILKENAFKELVVAIEMAVAGHRYISPVLQTNYSNQSQPLPLTPREKEILRHVCNGMSNKQISELLGISSKTVDVHRTNIMKKLRQHSTASLVHYSVTNGLV